MNEIRYLVIEHYFNPWKIIETKSKRPQNHTMSQRAKSVHVPYSNEVIWH